MLTFSSHGLWLYVLVDASGSRRWTWFQTWCVSVQVVGVSAFAVRSDRTGVWGVRLPGRLRGVAEGEDKKEYRRRRSLGPDSFRQSVPHSCQRGWRLSRRGTARGRERDVSSSVASISVQDNGKIPSFYLTNDRHHGSLYCLTFQQ